MRDVSRFEPQWARSGAGFYEAAEPERVRRLDALGITCEQVQQQLERTVKRRSMMLWQVRNLPGGGATAASPEAIHEPGGVGFLVTVPAPYRRDPGGYLDGEYRSPAEMVEMFVRAAGWRWRSALRMVIAINRLNDPRREPGAVEGLAGVWHHGLAGG